MSNFWINALIDVLLVIYVIDCFFMGLVIMMQRSKQEGLGAAFGGGFTDSIWGAQTSQVLVKATVYAAAIFFILSVTLARLYSMRETTNQPSSTVQQELEKSLAATPSSTNAASLTIPVSPAATATTPPAGTSTNASSASAVAPVTKPVPQIPTPR